MRLALWAVALGIGIALSVQGGLRPIALGVLAAVTAGVAFVPCVGGTARGAAVAFVLGVALGARALPVPPLAPAVQAAVRSDDAQAIVARVLRGPEQGGRGTRLVVALDSLGGAPARGVMLLAVIAGWPDFGPGERVAFRARLREVRGTRNPGLPDPELALRAAEIDVVGGVASAADLTRLADPPAGGLRRAAFRARRALRAATDAAVPGPPGAFLRTAVLGDRRGVGNDVEEGFSAAGATHVLSVSGLHLAAVVAVVFLAVRAAVGLVPFAALYVDPRAVAAAAALPAVVFFTLLTGEAVATERSAVMLAVGMGGILVGRPVSAAPAIAVAAIAILLAGPLRLFDPSLQLSLASVSGIAFLARRLGPPRDLRGGAARRALGWLWRFGAATIAATAFTAPLVAHDFAEIAPAAPLGNLALVPLVELGVVPLGLFGAALAALGAPLRTLGHLGLVAAGAAARLALAIAAAFRAHAPLVTCRMPNALETGALMAAAAGALWAVRARGPARWRALAVAGLAACVGAGSLGGRDWARRHDGALHATFLDVGQGDAAVIEAPGGVVAVIDGGGAFDDAFDPGERIVEPFLRARGISRVDLVALSHPHPDHLNGLRRVLARFPVAALWTSGDDGKNPEYGRLLELARVRGVPAPVPVPRALGAAWIQPLGPFVVIDGRDVVAPPPGLTVNDASLVLRVAFAGKALLFPGDLEADGEGELVGRRAVGQDVRADVLKVPHHGSRTSSSAELVDAVQPTLAVISLGWRNRFHFPAAEVLQRYAARSARLLRTDRDGAVTVTIQADGELSARCERSCGGAP